MKGLGFTMDQYQSNSQYSPNQDAMTPEMLPAQYRPLGAWTYFGYSLLFSIPIVGFILLIVFSCSSANINRRNFARSYWCWLVIVAIIVAVVFAVSGAAGLAFLDQLR